MKKIFNLLNLSILLILSSLILSCGNKGPLYIPDTSEPTAQHIIGVQ